MNISANLASIGANQTFLNTTANNIANSNTMQTDSFSSQQSQTDLSKEIPNLMVVEGVNALNVSAIKTQDEIVGTLLDTKA